MPLITVAGMPSGPYHDEGAGDAVHAPPHQPAQLGRQRPGPSGEDSGGLMITRMPCGRFGLGEREDLHNTRQVYVIGRQEGRSGARTDPVQDTDMLAGILGGIGHTLSARLASLARIAVITAAAQGTAPEKVHGRGVFSVTPRCMYTLSSGSPPQQSPQSRARYTRQCSNTAKHAASNTHEPLPASGMSERREQLSVCQPNLVPQMLKDQHPGTIVKGKEQRNGRWARLTTYLVGRVP